MLTIHLSIHPHSFTHRNLCVFTFEHAEGDFHLDHDVVEETRPRPGKRTKLNDDKPDGAQDRPEEVSST